MNLIEVTAKALHDGWWKAYANHGWKLGPRDDDNKRHPHLLDFKLCGLENNNFDRCMAALLLDILIPKIQKLREGQILEPEKVAPLFHLAWARSAELCGRRAHPHITNEWTRHKPVGKEEHLQQAKGVLAIYRKNKPIFSDLRSWRE
jgi:hypothetical protein